MQTPDVHAEAEERVLRAMLPAGVTTRTPTLRAFQALQVRVAPTHCAPSVAGLQGSRRQWVRCSAPPSRNAEF